MIEIPLPELGEGVQEGEVLDIKVSVGQSIKADDALIEIMTDKATVEIPSPSAGTVKEIHVEEGDDVEVGSTIVTLEG